MAAPPGVAAAGRTASADPIRPLVLNRWALLLLVAAPLAFVLYVTVLRQRPTSADIGGASVWLLLGIEGALLATTHWTLTRWWLFTPRGRWPRAAGARPLDFDRFDFLGAVWPTLATAAASVGAFVTFLRAPAVREAINTAPGSLQGVVLTAAAYALLGALAGASSALLTFDVAFAWLLVRTVWGRALLREKRGTAAAAAAMSASVGDLTAEWRGDPEAEERRDRVKRRLRLAARLAEGGAERGEQTERRQPLVKALRTLALVIDDCDEDGRKTILNALMDAGPEVASGGWAAATKPLEDAVLATRHLVSSPETPARKTPSWTRKAVATGVVLVVTYAVFAVVGVAPLGFDYAAAHWGQRLPAPLIAPLRAAFIVWVPVVVGGGTLAGLVARYKDDIPVLAAIVEKAAAWLDARKGAGGS